MKSFKDIAYQILKEEGVPLHSKDIVRIALKKKMLDTTGKTPESTMNAQLVVDINLRKGNSRFVKNRPSIFGLNKKYKEPDNRTINKKPIMEREVQLAVLDHLYKIGWGYHPYIKQTNEKGVDIRVQNDRVHSRYFFVETKGESDSKSANSYSENSFVNSLGQIVTRMSVVDARYAYNYGLGLPEKAAKTALGRIPWQFARAVCLYIFAVNRDGKVTQYSWKDMKKQREKIKDANNVTNK